MYSIVLLAAAGLSYLLNPSPFSLMTRLATGDLSLGINEVVFYVIPLAILCAIFLTTSKKLLSAQ